MLTFIKGTSGTKRTETLIKKIKELAKLDKKVLVIVPEQFSFETEKALLLKLGEEQFNKIKVMSFSFMASNILKSYGKFNKTRLDDNGKLIFINLAIESLKTKLKIFKGNKNIINISLLLMKILSDIKKFDINLKTLQKFCDNATNKELNLKISAILKIIDKYNNLISATYADPEDDLDILNNLLNEQDIFESYDVFFDSFVSFSAKEFKIIKHILNQAQGIYFSFCCDNLKTFDNYELFSPVKNTINLIKNSYEGNIHEIYLDDHSRFLNDELKFLEENIFRDDKKCFDERTKNITLYKAKNIYEECEFVARKIKQLVAREGYNYSDFAVIFRQFEDYDGVIENIFNEYDVPYFLDAPKRVDTKPLMNLVLFAFDIIHNNYKQDDIINFLKTGLVSFSTEEISMLENYAFVWDINSKAWLDEFKSHPRGFEAEFTSGDLEILNKLNAMRKKIITPLINFGKKIKNATGEQISCAIFELLEELNIKENLKLYSKKLYENQEYTLSDEQLRLWKILINVLEQMATALNNIKISSKLFAEILKRIFANQDILFIPKGVDEVTIGNIQRMRPASPKVTFLIGAVEGKFPEIKNKNILFNLNEIKQLKDNNINFFESIDEITSNEMLLVYFALTSPSKQLFASYYEQDTQGKECYPSVMIREIKKIFKNINVEFDEILDPLDLIWTKSSALNMMAKVKDKNESLYISLKEALKNDKSYSDKIKSLENFESREFNFKDTNNLNKLIGKNIELSASQVEKYYLCPFAYFCRYILKAKPINKAKPSPIEYGNAVHFILEKMLSQFSVNQLCSMQYQDIRLNVKNILKIYIKRFGNFKDLSERFKFLISKCVESACTLVNYVAYELKASGFNPKAMEFPIKKLDKPLKIELKDKSFVTISGYIDRIDILEKNSTKYVRIVDYKTGIKEFKLSDVVQGLNMQMLIYLKALLCSNKSNSIKPAGILYMPADAKANIASKHTSEEELERLNKNKFKMNGLIANDDLITTNLKDSVKKSSIINLNQDKYNPFEVILKILVKVEEKIKVMAQNLKEGKVSPKPAKASKSACEFCDYSYICNFEDENDFSKTQNLTNEQVVEILLEENYEQI